MPASAKLLSIATANAPNVMTQTDVVRVAQALFRDRFPGIDRMLPVFDTAGIRTRQSAMPLDWYLTPRSWPEPRPISTSRSACWPEPRKRLSIKQA